MSEQQNNVAGVKSQAEIFETPNWNHKNTEPYRRDRSWIHKNPPGLSGRPAVAQQAGRGLPSVTPSNKVV